MATTKSALVVQATKKFDEAIGNFTNLTESINWLVDHKAWEIIGYASFREGWEARSELKFPKEVRGLAIDRLHKTTKLTQGAIAKLVGVSGPVAHSVIRNIANGVAPKDAGSSIYSSPGFHSSPNPKKTQYQEWDQMNVSTRFSRAELDAVKIAKGDLSIAAFVHTATMEKVRGHQGR